MARTFLAKYHGECAECSERVEPGDLLRYNEDDEVVHAEHTATPDHRLPPMVVICTTCFCAKPCFCEEDVEHA